MKFTFKCKIGDRLGVTCRKCPYFSRCPYEKYGDATELYEQAIDEVIDILREIDEQERSK
jgi:hypothetical protein